MTKFSAQDVIVSVTPGNPFYRIITNSDSAPFEGRAEALDEAIVKVREYAAFVLEGSHGKPFCPYVRQTELENGYIVQPYHEDPRQLDLNGIVSELEREFKRRSPCPTTVDRPLDTTIIIAAFAHEEAYTEEFCRRMEQAYEENRVHILEQGMLIGYMSPAHPPDQYGESLFKSPISMLSVDRLHRSHVRFMRNAVERGIHASFFGDGRS